MGILTGNRHSGGRQGALQLHRLYEFEKAFNEYLVGRCPASRVKNRAEKMSQVGLPRLK